MLRWEPEEGEALPLPAPEAAAESFTKGGETATAR